MDKLVSIYRKITENGRWVSGGGINSEDTGCGYGFCFEWNMAERIFVFGNEEVVG